MIVEIQSTLNKVNVPVVGTLKFWPSSRQEVKSRPTVINSCSVGYEKSIALMLFFYTTQQ